MHGTKSLGVISGPTRHLYFKELKDVVTHCLRHNVTAPFRIFLRQWIRKGAPIDPAALYLPKPSAEIILRQIGSCLPGLPEDIKASATLWLLQPECRFPGQQIPKSKVPAREYQPAWLPFNICLYAPKGSTYAEFSEKGFELKYLEPDELKPNVR